MLHKFLQLPETAGFWNAMEHTSLEPAITSINLRLCVKLVILVPVQCPYNTPKITDTATSTICYIIQIHIYVTLLKHSNQMTPFLSHDQSAGLYRAAFHWFITIHQFQVDYVSAAYNPLGIPSHSFTTRKSIPFQKVSTLTSHNLHEVLATSVLATWPNKKDFAKINLPIRYNLHNEDSLHLIPRVDHITASFNKSILIKSLSDIRIQEVKSICIICIECVLKKCIDS